MGIQIIIYHGGFSEIRFFRMLKLKRALNFHICFYAIINFKYSQFQYIDNRKIDIIV